LADIVIHPQAQADIDERAARLNDEAFERDVNDGGAPRSPCCPAAESFSLD